MNDPWQDFDAEADPGPPFGTRHPACIRTIGVAGLIATQASFPVGLCEASVQMRA